MAVTSNQGVEVIRRALLTVAETTVTAVTAVVTMHHRHPLMEAVTAIVTAAVGDSVVAVEVAGFMAAAAAADFTVVVVAVMVVADIVKN